MIRKRPPEGGYPIHPRGDGRAGVAQYCDRVIDKILQPDRRQSRGLKWLAADALVAGLFIWITVESLRSSAYIDEYGRIEGLGWLLAISPTLLLFIRRLVPLTAMVGATLLYMVASAFQGDSNAPLAVPLFSYSVAMSRPANVSAWLVGAAAAAMSLSIFYGPGDPTAILIPILIGLFAIGWLVATSIRANQARAELLAVEASNARAESARVAREAVDEERARIARELHDAVGHAVNVIVMQAGAARLSATDSQAIDSLRQIEQVGRDALSDLDQMLGLLHEDGASAASLEPARTLGDIEQLVENLRSTGSDVHLHNRCEDATNATRQIGIAAYRIVQEALTNAMKHAGPARIEVTIECSDDHIEVAVVDDGLGAAALQRDGGRGIAGMAERARLLGGDLTAQPLTDGGFQVVARLPRHRQRFGRERTEP